MSDLRIVPVLESNADEYRVLLRPVEDELDQSEIPLVPIDQIYGSGEAEHLSAVHSFHHDVAVPDRPVRDEVVPEEGVEEGEVDDGGVAEVAWRIEAVRSLVPDADEDEIEIVEHPILDDESEAEEESRGEEVVARPRLEEVPRQAERLRQAPDVVRREEERGRPFDILISSDVYAAMFGFQPPRHREVPQSRLPWRGWEVRRGNLQPWRGVMRQDALPTAAEDLMRDDGRMRERSFAEELVSEGWALESSEASDWSDAEGVAEFSDSGDEENVVEE